MTALSLLVLTGCTSADSLRDAAKTASGFVREAGSQIKATVELGKMGIDKAASVAGEAERRAKDLQEGIGKIQEGKVQVEKALK